MRIVIMGAGAIGSIYGGFLQKAGNNVVLVGRQPHVEAVQSTGLHISGLLGDFTVHPAATVDPTQLSHADYVFITTKAYDTVEAAKSIRHLADSGAIIILLQNGLLTEYDAESVLTGAMILRATTCMGSQLESPGHVRVTGIGLTEIGSHKPDSMNVIRDAVRLLKSAGFEVRGCDNIAGVVWTKTIVNCALNPVAALTGLRNGEIYKNPLLRDLVIRLVRETALVAEKLGVSLTTTDPIRYTLGTAKATAENVNSMLQDIRVRKRTEIDSLTGLVLRIAHHLGLRLPVSETIYALVKGLEERTCGKIAPAPIPHLNLNELISAISSH